MNRHPIYIPSRHRPECATAQLLDSLDIHFQIVIEPHDREQYSKRWPSPNLMILPEDDQGLAWSRKFIKTWSAYNKESHHWQIDDDVKGFLARVPNKPSVKLAASYALSKVEDLMNEYSNLGIAGFNQNSWPPKGHIFFNDLPVQAVLINNSVPVFHRSELPLMSDFDFVLQCMRFQWASAMFDSIRVITPPIGSRTGGLQEVYAAKKLNESAKILAGLWPDLKVDFHPDGSLTIWKKELLKKMGPPPKKREPLKGMPLFE